MSFYISSFYSIGTWIAWMDLWSTLTDLLCFKEHEHEVWEGHFVKSSSSYQTLSSYFVYFMYSCKNRFWEHILSRALNTSWNNSLNVVFWRAFPLDERSLKVSSLRGSVIDDKKAYLRFESSTPPMRKKRFVICWKCFSRSFFCIEQYFILKNFAYSLLVIWVSCLQNST